MLISMVPYLLLILMEVYFHGMFIEWKRDTVRGASVISLAYSGLKVKQNPPL